MSFFLKALAMFGLFIGCLLGDQEKMVAGWIVLGIVVALWIIAEVVDDSDFYIPSSSSSYTSQKSSSSKYEGTDLAYWSNKRREEEREQAKFDSEIRKNREDAQRIQDREWDLREKRAEYEQKQREERAEREEKWRKGL